MDRLNDVDRALARRFAELRNDIDRLETKLDLILGHLQIQTDATVLKRSQPSALVLGLVKSKKVLHAIKAYREETKATREEAERVIRALAKL